MKTYLAHVFLALALFVLPLLCLTTFAQEANGVPKEVEQSLLALPEISKLNNAQKKH